MDPFIAAAQKAITALEESIEFNAVPDWSPSIERRREAILALQRALHSNWVPQGWQLVPIMPTRGMHQAHDDAWRAVDRCWAPLPEVTQRAWREMLRAAPTPPLVSVPAAPALGERDAGSARAPQAQMIVRRVQVSLSRLG